MVAPSSTATSLPAGNPGIVPPWLRNDEATILPVPEPATAPAFVLPSQFAAEVQGIVDALQAAGILELRIA